MALEQSVLVDAGAGSSGLDAEAAEAARIAAEQERMLRLANQSRARGASPSGASSSGASAFVDVSDAPAAPAPAAPAPAASADPSAEEEEYQRQLRMALEQSVLVDAGAGSSGLDAEAAEAARIAAEQERMLRLANQSRAQGASPGGASSSGASASDSAATASVYRSLAGAGAGSSSLGADAESAEAARIAAELDRQESEEAAVRAEVAAAAALAEAIQEEEFMRGQDALLEADERLASRMQEQLASEMEEALEADERLASRMQEQLASEMEEETEADERLASRMQEQLASEMEEETRRRDALRAQEILDQELAQAMVAVMDDKAASHVRGGRPAKQASPVSYSGAALGYKPPTAVPPPSNAARYKAAKGKAPVVAMPAPWDAGSSSCDGVRRQQLASAPQAAQCSPAGSPPSHSPASQSSTARSGAASSSASASWAGVVCPARPPITAGGARVVTVVLDGMNIARHQGFQDPLFVGPAKEAWLSLRREDNNRAKPEMAAALIAAIEHCRAASNRAREAGAGLSYQPMAFLPEWAIDGGKSGKRGCFGAERLEEYSWCVTRTPPRRDDDKPQINFVKSQISMGCARASAPARSLPCHLLRSRTLVLTPFGACARVRQARGHPCDQRQLSGPHPRGIHHARVV